MAQVLSFVLIFFCYLDNIDSSHWIASLTTSLAFLGSLDLRLISRRGIVGLNLVFVFVGSLIAVLLRGVVLAFFGQHLVAF